MSRRLQEAEEFSSLESIRLLARAFRYVAPFALVIILVFGLLYGRDRAAGGYRAEKLGEDDWEEDKA